MACCRMTHRGGLVDDGAAPGSLAPALAQHTLGAHRSQSLVDEANRATGVSARRQRCRPARQRTRAPCRPRLRPPGQRARQPDDDLDGVVLLGQVGDPRRGRRDRAGTVSTGVADRPSRSQTATPIRTSPTSTPETRAPGRQRRARLGSSSSRGGQLLVTRSPIGALDRRDRRGGLGRVGAAALRDVVLAAAVAARARSPRRGPGRRPCSRHSRARSLSATTTLGLPSAAPTTVTTAGRSAGSRPRMSSASLRTSAAAAPSATWPTNATPKTSRAPAASSPARAEQRYAPRIRSISFSAVRSRSTQVVDAARKVLRRRLERLGRAARRGRARGRGSGSPRCR